MDIKQMKNFVSQELKGLKQEHRLLSLRRCKLGAGEGGCALQGSAAVAMAFFQEETLVLLADSLI